MAALCCLACNDSKIVTVTVTNPLAMDRSDEMVEVSMTEISNLLNLADTAQIVVLNVEGEQVPYQVTYDDKFISLLRSPPIHRLHIPSRPVLPSMWR